MSVLKRGNKKQECTLSDQELIDKCEWWVHKLAESHGKAWTLRIPPDFNYDPDMLFIELVNRFKVYSPHIDQFHDDDIFDNCPECGRRLYEFEYDAQCCRACGWGGCEIDYKMLEEEEQEEVE